MSETRTRPAAREGDLSIVAREMKIVGELHTDGVVKVDGVVEGNVYGGRQVLVSKGGRVLGDVHTGEAIIGGRVEGGIFAKDRVEVQPEASVNGDIATKRIVVHEGGEVNGRLRMGEDKPADAKAGQPDVAAEKKRATSWAGSRP